MREVEGSVRLAAQEHRHLERALPGKDVHLKEAWLVQDLKPDDVPLARHRMQNIGLRLVARQRPGLDERPLTVLLGELELEPKTHPTVGHSDQRVGLGPFELPEELREVAQRGPADWAKPGPPQSVHPGSVEVERLQRLGPRAARGRILLRTGALPL